ncbi:hypothetical protein R1flu_022478 [Riccia fluitans]|uniref:non-specific serine/threonine protein kinase n=1 Tax=Riccia fluitans TaxID=41844 RepID=A0ABD1XS67_9MARC
MGENKRSIEGQVSCLAKFTTIVTVFSTIASLIPTSYGQRGNSTATNGTLSTAVANLEFGVTDFNSSEMFFTGSTLVDNGTLLMTVNASKLSEQKLLSRAVYRSKVQLYNASSGQAASFNTSFTFAIVAPTGAEAKGDGMTFLFTPTPSAPASDYSAGGNLALYEVITYNRTNTSIHTVAVEFDTNSDTQVARDPVGDHIGLDINSFISTRAQTLRNAKVPFSELNTSSLSQQLTAWIDYDAVSGQLDVYLAAAPSSKTSATRVLTYQPLCLYQWAENESYVGFTAATGGAYEIHAVSSWSFASRLVSNPLPPQNISIYPDESSSSASSAGLIAGTTVAGVSVAFMFVLALVACICWKKKKEVSRKRKQAWAMRPPLKSADGEEILGPEDSFWLDLYGGDPKYGPKTFTAYELQEATNNFDTALIMGQGGSGTVYKGQILGVTKDGTQKIDVAVKRLNDFSKQRIREFRAEVQSIGQLRHKNLVHLYGWCHDEGELLLVYEYMPFGSLDRHLYTPQFPALPWEDRYSILCGVAETLVYIHVGCEKCIVHRDIKPSNILLDSSRNARLGDFGLARLVDHRESARDHSTIVAGTRGYIAPEYSVSGKATPESDIFSFGVLTLVVTSGTRPYEIEEDYIVDRAWAAHEANELVERMADRRLGGVYDAEQMRTVLEVGLLCTHPDPVQRLPTKMLLQALTTTTQQETAAVDIPSLPEFRPVAVYVSRKPDSVIVSLQNISPPTSAYESSEMQREVGPSLQIKVEVDVNKSEKSFSGKESVGYCQEMQSLTFPR